MEIECVRLAIEWQWPEISDPRLPEKRGPVRARGTTQLEWSSLPLEKGKRDNVVMDFSCALWISYLKFQPNPLLAQERHAQDPIDLGSKSRS